MVENQRIFSESAKLTEDERKILLLGLKVLYADVAVARVLGYPVDPIAIKNLVAKLGGIPSLL
jgi:hypothetical protein